MTIVRLRALLSDSLRCLIIIIVLLRDNSRAVDMVSQSLLPKPTSPIATGSTSNSVVLFVEMNDFDRHHNVSANEPTAYGFQILTGCDDLLGWKNLSLKAVMSIGKGFPISATITNLTASTCYRFRARAFFGKIVSAWSFPSEDVYTKSSIPVMVTTFQIIGVETESVTVRWNLSLPNNFERDKSGMVDSCILQYSMNSTIYEGRSKQPIQWIDYRKSISMISEPSVVEIHSVTTLVDSESKITSGSFRLKLLIPKSAKSDLSNTISSPIPYNSTPKDFEEALSKIDGVIGVRVFKSQSDSIITPAHDARGTYTWRVEFLDMADVYIPLLQIYEDSFDGTYIPGKARVCIRRLQSGAPAKYLSSVQINVDHLVPSTSYTFRVACQNKYGISDWSQPSESVLTKPPFNTSDARIFHKSNSCTGAARNAKLHLSKIQHNSAILKWIVLQNAAMASALTGFEVELSAGQDGSADEQATCSDEFTVVDVRTVNNTYAMMTSKLTSLRPNTAYCVRLVAYCRDGSAEQGIPIQFASKSMPFNHWFRVDSFESVDKTMKSNLPHDEYALCDIPKRPTPRRGHSLIMIDEKIYLFGGLGSICSCKSDFPDSCSFSIMYSNDLWSFNTISRLWTLLHRATIDVGHPSAREQYSATKIANGKIIYIGGRTSKSRQMNDNRKLYLGDVWELDPGQRNSHQFLASSTASVPKSITDGKIMYHTMKITPKINEGYRQSELCVRGITVEVMFEHECIEEVLQLSLVGPKYTQRSNRPSTGTLHEITLFIRSATKSLGRGQECSSQLTNITFSDESREKILDHRYQIPKSGFFQATEMMNSHLYGSELEGLWTIAITDSTINNKTGTLLHWALNVETQYCTDGYEWKLLGHHSPSDEDTYSSGKKEMATQSCTNIESDGRTLSCSSHKTSDTRLKPRYRHAAMAVGNDVFVLDGRADALYFETWKFDYDQRRWTLLRSVDRVPHLSGQSAVLTPFGMFAFGGIKENNDAVKRKNSDILQYDILNAKWSTISTENSMEDAPQWRYLTALCYVGLEHLFVSPQDLNPADHTALSSKTSPTIIMFGGDADSSDFPPELWAYSMKGNEAYARDFGNRRTKERFCNGILLSTKHDNDPWEWSCGFFGGNYSETACDWVKIVERAWCLGQYQSFYMPHG